MSAPDMKRLSEIKVDTDNLYREEMFTDLKVATIQRLTPVKADGSPDPSRKPMLVAQTTVMSRAGLVPVQAPIEADSLEEAIRKFPEAIQKAVEQMIEEIKELQRQEASRIVVARPGTGSILGGPGRGPGGSGGMPGGPGKV